MEIPLGTLFGRYRIHSLIGTGGMGEVYLALDTKLKRRVALKVLPKKFTDDESRLHRFEQEACTASALNHPNILTVYEIGEESSVHFIACEYIEGITLRKRIEDGQITLREIIDAGMQIASALCIAHQAGIVHRDIKPENIMVRHDGYLKILDFGLAKLTERETYDANSETLVETEPGTVLGTAKYMSPEQARGLPLDGRSDIWSLGAVMYEMLTGHCPFEGQTPTDVYVAILEKDPSPIKNYLPNIPEELEDVIRGTLIKDKESRYQSSDELLADLAAVKNRLESDGKLDLSTQLARAAAKPSTTNAGNVSTDATPAQPSSKGYRASTLRTATVSKRTVQESKFNKRLLLLILTVLGASIATALIVSYSTRPSPNSNVNSIAVIPFAFDNNNPDLEYYADGVTESIISNLSQLHNLRVIARATVFQFKNKNPEPTQVGHQLGVDAVVMGRIVQHGDNFVISAEMVSASDGSQIWGAQYRQKSDAVLSIPQEIAQRISENLKIKVSGEERKQLAKRYTDNVEAYQLYLKGRFAWNKRTAEGFNEAITYFQKAIAADANYALAYAGLADSYTLLGLYNSLPPNSVLPKAKEAAEKALAIDDQLAEAHTSRARVLAEYDWNWTEAEAAYKRAIELNPNYPVAHHWYALHLMSRGRQDEAIAELREAQKLDPLSFSINASMGLPYYYARQYDRSIAEFRKTLDVNQTLPLTHVLLGQAYAQKGNFDEAINELQQARQLEDSPQIEAILAHILALTNRKAEAEKILNQLKEENRYVPSYFISMVYLGLGDKDQAMEWLERAYAERSGWLVLLRVEPRWDSIRTDQRFKDLERRIGL